MRKYHYGVKDLSHLRSMADHVCDVLGNGKRDVADLLLIETAAAETQCGLYKDRTPDAAGYGITQFDHIGFIDTKMRTRHKDYLKILNHFNIDITKSQIQDLEENPLLALIFTRLKYKLIPDIIPGDLISRAMYWKRFYNTSAGKGTIEHYLASVERHLNLEEEYK